MPEKKKAGQDTHVRVISSNDLKVSYLDIEKGKKNVAFNQTRAKLSIKLWMDEGGVGCQKRKRPNEERGIRCTYRSSLRKCGETLETGKRPQERLSRFV